MEIYFYVFKVMVISLNYSNIFKIKYIQENVEKSLFNHK